MHVAVVVFQAAPQFCVCLVLHLFLWLGFFFFMFFTMLSDRKHVYKVNDYA
jgi:hypothetical protein